MKYKTFLMTIVMFALSVNLHAQNSSPSLKIDMPFFDLPFQLNAWNASGDDFFSRHINPSMNQSVAITTGLYSTLHFGMRHFYENSNIDNAKKRRFRLFSPRNKS